MKLGELWGEKIFVQQGRKTSYPRCYRRKNYNPTTLDGCGSDYLLSFSFNILKDPCVLFLCCYFSVVKYPFL